MVTAVQSYRRLQTREARKALPTREEPYWYEVRRGLALGYHRGSDGGSWRLREFRDGRYVKRRLGTADDEVPADGQSVLAWADALKIALGVERPTLTAPGHYTVNDAAEAYFAVRAKRSSIAHDKTTFKAFIEEKLGGRIVGELTTGELNRWLADQVPETDDREKRRSAQATANRRFTVLRAILNFAYQNEPDRVPSADAWRRVQPFKKVDQPRQRFLSAAEAKRLLNALPADLRALARGSLYTGARLGELLALKAGHVADDRVHIVHSKSGRSRRIPLSPEGAEFFEQQTAGKTGDALVLPTADEAGWSRMAISRAMKAACIAASIKPPATFHDLRRSYGSLLLNSGAPADVIQELLGHADLRMTRRAYAHLLDKTLAKAVKKHLPSFGLERSNVSPLKRKEVFKKA